MTREEFEALRNTVHGIGTRRHVELVEGVIRWARPRHVVEIGAFQGFVSCSIVRALQDVQAVAGGDLGRLTVVDNFFDYNQPPPKAFRNHLSRFGSNWELQIATSETMRVKEVDMAVIDANHTYEWCKKDALASIEAGAWILMFHDSQEFEGVRMVVDELEANPRWGVVRLPFDAGWTLAIENFETPPPIYPSGITSWEELDR